MAYININCSTISKVSDLLIRNDRDEVDVEYLNDILESTVSIILTKQIIFIQNTRNRVQ